MRVCFIQTTTSATLQNRACSSYSNLDGPDNTSAQMKYAHQFKQQLSAVQNALCTFKVHKWDTVGN